MVLIVSLILVLKMQHELQKINRQRHLLLQAKFQNEFLKNSAAISRQGRNEIQKKLNVLNNTNFIFPCGDEGVMKKSIIMFLQVFLGCAQLQPASLAHNFCRHCRWLVLLLL